jgi:hypothetical protein
MGGSRLKVGSRARAAIAAEPVLRGIPAAAGSADAGKGIPQLPQNLLPCGFSAPQLGQSIVRTLLRFQPTRIRHDAEPDSRKTRLKPATPWPIRCSFSTSANRTCPSPSAPKPMPGLTATRASRASLTAN